MSRLVRFAIAASCIVSFQCVAVLADTNTVVHSSQNVVTPDRLLEHIKERRPEVGALQEIAWGDNGTRVIISVSGDREVSPDDFKSYEITAVEPRTGATAVIGAGYGVESAPRGNLVAFYPAQSGDRRVTLARANGDRLCTIVDTDLMPDSNGIQAVGLTGDGNHVALAIGYGLTQPRLIPPASGEGGAQVKIFDSALQSRAGANRDAVALWILDHRCSNARLISKIEHYRIGRLAWANPNAPIIALASRRMAEFFHPRSDLLIARQRSASSWQVLRSNVGEQARRVSSVSFLRASPDGRHVAVSFDEEGLPYAIRKQLAIVSVNDGSLRVVSADPRTATGWLDSQVLWMTVMAGHSSLASAATLGLDGTERPLPDVPGYAVPSPRGRELAWITTDLYGNSSLAVAALNRDGGKNTVSNERIVWRKELVSNKRYARAMRRMMQCETDDGVRPAALLVLPLGYREGQRYPLIVDIHGGPRGGLDVAGWPYTPPVVLSSSTLEHDMWAAKGYAILAPDYRASGLYGFDKVSREGHIYANDFKDIMCNVDKAVDDGIADPNRMAVVGHSHGGTEVNWIVTQTPRFKAAISKEGSYNIDARITWGQSGYANDSFTIKYGNPLEFPDRYRRMSMIEAVRNVTTPTMFVEHQGGRKPGDLYKWLYAAWQQRGIKTQLRTYDAEEHVLQDPADQRDILNACIDWIDTLLGTPSKSFESSMIQYGSTPPPQSSPVAHPTKPYTTAPR